MDEDSYPENIELEKITDWDAIEDPVGLIGYIRSLWRYADIGYFEFKDGRLELHTGGWSGNELIIDALEKNEMFWVMFWQKSERGGHYFFNDELAAGNLKLTQKQA